MPKRVLESSIQACATAPVMRKPRAWPANALQPQIDHETLPDDEMRVDDPGREPPRPWAFWNLGVPRTQTLQSIDDDLWWKVARGTAYRMIPASDPEGSGVLACLPVIGRPEEKFPVLNKDLIHWKRDRCFYPEPMNLPDVLSYERTQILPIGQRLKAKGYDQKGRHPFIKISLGTTDLCSVSTWKIGIMRARDLADLLIDLVEDKELLPTKGQLCTCRDKWLKKFMLQGGSVAFNQNSVPGAPLPPFEVMFGEPVAGP